MHLKGGQRCMGVMAAAALVVSLVVRVIGLGGAVRVMVAGAPLLSANGSGRGWGQGGSDAAQRQRFS